MLTLCFRLVCCNLVFKRRKLYYARIVGIIAQGNAIVVCAYKIHVHVSQLIISNLYVTNNWSTLYTYIVFSLFYTYLNYSASYIPLWVLPGISWLWMSQLHLLLNYKRKLKWEGNLPSHGEPIWSGCCMFAVAIDLIVHHIWDILRLKNAENSSGQHPFLYQRRRTSASSDTLSRWLKHDKLTLSSTVFFLLHALMYDWTRTFFQLFVFFYICG